MERLFWIDPYMTEFDSRVAEIDGGRIVLEATAFFPESGGQIGDVGFLNEVPVLDTEYSKSGKKIYHVVDSAGLARFVKGIPVHGVADGARRLRVMQHHSALHLVFLLFQEKYGEHKVVGSEVREDKARVDFAFFGRIDIEALQARVNEVLAQDLEIRTYPSEGIPGRRIWEVASLPPIPCGGTHVRRTGEIGSVRLKRKSLGSQGVRVYCEVEG